MDTLSDQKGCMPVWLNSDNGDGENHLVPFKLVPLSCLHQGDDGAGERRADVGAHNDGDGRLHFKHYTHIHHIDHKAWAIAVVMHALANTTKYCPSLLFIDSRYLVISFSFVSTDS